MQNTETHVSLTTDFCRSSGWTLNLSNRKELVAATRALSVKLSRTGDESALFGKTRSGRSDGEGEAGNDADRATVDTTEKQKWLAVRRAVGPREKLDRR